MWSWILGNGPIAEYQNFTSQPWNEYYPDWIDFSPDWIEYYPVWIVFNPLWKNIYWVLSLYEFLYLFYSVTLNMLLSSDRLPTNITWNRCASSELRLSRSFYHTRSQNQNVIFNGKNMTISRIKHKNIATTTAFLPGVHLL